ncbi:MAG: hypothetical protein ACRDQ5_15590, partial [Sciscionella sp.]
MLIEGPAWWGEFCPFADYDDTVSASWLGHHGRTIVVSSLVRCCCWPGVRALVTGSRRLVHPGSRRADGHWDAGARGRLTRVVRVARPWVAL